MERLAALIPPPHKNQVIYHGVLALNTYRYPLYSIRSSLRRPSWRRIRGLGASRAIGHYSPSRGFSERRVTHWEPSVSVALTGKGGDCSSEMRGTIDRSMSTFIARSLEGIEASVITAEENHPMLNMGRAEHITRCLELPGHLAGICCQNVHVGIH